MKIPDDLPDVSDLPPARAYVNLLLSDMFLKGIPAILLVRSRAPGAMLPRRLRKHVRGGDFGIARSGIRVRRCWPVPPIAGPLTDAAARREADCRQTPRPNLRVWWAAPANDERSSRDSRRCHQRPWLRRSMICGEPARGVSAGLSARPHRQPRAHGRPSTDASARRGGRSRADTAGRPSMPPGQTTNTCFRKRRGSMAPNAVN